MIPSCSARTVVYKGMLTAPQLPGFYPDLRDPRTESALALVHSRYSTNTFPSWELAHPYRLIAHNGEINTLRGNVNWMRARESQLASELFGDDLRRMLPVVRPGGSDSATFDNVLELLVLAGRSLPHAVMMMIPEAYDGRDDVSEELAGFYAYHQCLMEAWDGPAAIAFTDGRVIGATLDRNGLRPGRWLETARRLGRARVRDGRARGAAGERRPQGPPAAGQALPRRRRERPHRPGRRGEADDRDAPPVRRVVPERGRAPRGPAPARDPRRSVEPLRKRQLAFGYTQDDMKVILAPLARNAEEAVGSMGNDLPLAVLSDRRPLLYSYFKQLFAQVTNPPIDSIREAVVMSVQASVGSERNLLDETPEHARQLVIANPILLDDELERLRQVDCDVFRGHTLDTTWPVAAGPDGLEERGRADLRRGRRRARRRREHPRPLRPRGRAGARADPAAPRRRRRPPPPRPRGHAPAGGAGRRVGRAAQRPQRRVLIGYGAAAVNPYLMLETLAELVELGWLPPGMTAEDAQRRATKGIAKGLLKTISKMGISTIPSYCGAQIFEAVGLAQELVDRHFTGTPSRIGGIGLDVLARETLDRHARAYPGSADGLLPVIGLYAWRRDGEHHPWNPDTIALLQHAVRSGGYETYEEYSRIVNDDVGAPLDAARPAPLPRGAGRRRPARRGRAGGGDRQALLDRRDVARLALARGARDARDRDEPDRRPLEHGRGRGGPGALRPGRERRLAPLGDQAGRLGPLRRQRALPRERGRAADQDGAGREARRGRPAARPQGRPLHRERAPDDARASG